MKNAQCLLCQAGAEVDLSMSNPQIGKVYGVSKDSARRHRRHVLEAVDPIFSEIPEAIITSRGKTVRLPDGSYEKVTYQPAKKALLDALSYDDLERAVEGYDYRPQVHTQVLQPVASVLNAADLQIGKAQQRGGGSEGTVQRALNSIHTFGNLCKQRGPQEIVLVDNGDGIEGIFNVPTQLVTNDLDLSAQIRTFRRLMIEAIKVLAPLSPKLTYVSVPSNHGAVRSGYKTQAGTTDADFGLEISYQLQDVCAENSALADVQFVRPRELYETAELTAGGTKLAFHHGHQTAGQNGHDKWWSGQDHGRMPGWDADILVVAHYHNLRVEQSGDGRWIIGVSSGEPSSDWYTNRTGQSSLRGMTTFDVQDGQWSNLAIV